MVQMLILAATVDCVNQRQRTGWVPGLAVHAVGMDVAHGISGWGQKAAGGLGAGTEVVDSNDGELEPDVDAARTS